MLSPLAHEVLRSLNRWQDIALKVLTAKGPPTEDYIPGNIHNYINKNFSIFIPTTFVLPGNVREI